MLCVLWLLPSDPGLASVGPRACVHHLMLLLSALSTAVHSLPPRSLRTTCIVSCTQPGPAFFMCSVLFPSGPRIPLTSALWESSQDAQDLTIVFLFSLEMLCCTVCCLDCVFVSTLAPASPQCLYSLSLPDCFYNVYFNDSIVKRQCWMIDTK